MRIWHGHIRYATLAFCIFLKYALKLEPWYVVQLKPAWRCLIHWGRETHVCDNKLTIIVSDYGLSPCQRQAIIWTNAGMLIMLIGTLGTHFSEILSEIHTFYWRKCIRKWRAFCLGLNVLTRCCIVSIARAWTKPIINIIAKRMCAKFIVAQWRPWSH